jgi:excisionase family DNA binding protein
MITVSAAAERLGVSPKHIYRLCDEGELTYVRLGKRKIGIPEESLAEFIKARTCRSEKTREAAGTLNYVSGGKEFIASAQRTRQRHRRSSSKPKSAKIYTLPEPEPQTA